MTNATRITPVQGVCSMCGCTDLTPCVDEVTGECCQWIDEEQTLCSDCALEILAGEDQLIIEPEVFPDGSFILPLPEQARPGSDPPLVINATESECDRFLRARRAAAGG